MSSDLATTGDPTASALEQFKAAMGADAAIPGLESVRAEDLALPIINVDHEKNAFVDKLTGTEYKEIDGVLLGLLKQRVMWDPTQGPKSKGLLCKSRNAEIGEPKEAFPWDEYKAKNGPGAVGNATVACATCPFAQWGSHPTNDTPWCSLQHTYPVVIGTGEDVTGLLTLQRSAIKPSNAYITGFVRDGAPMFTARTKITLDANRQGTVNYSVPKFSRNGATPADVDLWGRWSEAFNRIKTTVQGSGVVGSDSKSAVVVPSADTTQAADKPAAAF